jgi:hypothetical protein
MIPVLFQVIVRDILHVTLPHPNAGGTTAQIGPAGSVRLTGSSVLRTTNGVVASTPNLEDP